MMARARRLKNVITLVASLLIGVAAVEVVLRLVKPPFFSTRQWEYHPVFGWTQRPDTRFYSYASEHARPVRLEFNDEGYRDIDHIVAKPPNTRRIVVIGDSFCEATQVDLHQTFWWRLGELLNDRSRFRWEVLNFGVGDYGTVQEYMTLEKRGLEYAPELVILQTFPLNDVCNNSLEGAMICSPQDRYRPYLETANGRVEITYAHPVSARLRQFSFVFRYTEAIFRSRLTKFDVEAERLASDAVRRLGLPEDLGSIEPDNPARKLLGLVLNTLSRPEHQFDFIESGWSATEAVVERIIGMTDENDVPLVAVVMPHPSQLSPRFQEWQRHLPFPVDRHYAEHRLSELFERHEVPAVELIDVFEDHHSEVVPFIDGHLNAEAHALVAHLLEQEVSLLLPELPVYQLGERVAFEPGGPGSAMLTSGFAPPEKQIAWSVQPEARLSFQLSSPPHPGDLVLRVRAVPFAPLQLGDDQFADVFCNGESVGRWRLSGDSIQDYQATLPKDVVGPDHQIEIRFVFSERRSPRDLGISPDVRLLGLALFEMRVELETDP